MAKPDPVMIGVVGMLLCLSSSAAAYVMMSGDDDKKTDIGPSPTGPSPTGGTGGTGGRLQYDSVTCKTNAPGGKEPTTTPTGPGSVAVFSAIVDESDNFYLLRHYPTDVIAASWDPNWESAKEIEDCTKYEVGEDMKVRHPLFGIDKSASVSCKKNNSDGRGPNTIYKIHPRSGPPQEALLFVHPDPPTAADAQIEDCTGVRILS